MKKFYPAVHCFDFNQTQYNLLLALKHKADGVFMINHNQMSELTFDLIVDTISAAYKDQIKIGANFLNLSNIEALEKAVDFGLDMLWVDNAGCDDCESLEAMENAFDFFHRTSELDGDMKVQIFGGVHFKYQPKPKSSIEKSVFEVWKLMMTPTLSGSATGQKADVDFVKRAYDSLCKNSFSGRSELAIASGVSIKNVYEYIPYIDRFLVASSILDKKDERMFDGEKLKMLCETIHNYKENV